MAAFDSMTKIFCESCDEKEKGRIPADGFCLDCETYYCKTCFEYHNQFLPEHKQQDKSSMPPDFYDEKCNDHSRNLIKFYCQSCGVAACGTCKKDHHGQCGRVFHLSELVKRFEHSADFKNVENTMNSLETDVEKIEKNVKMDTEKVGQYSEDARNALQTQKTKVMKMFDDFETEIDNYESAFKAEAKKEKVELRQMKTNILNLKSEIYNKKLPGQRCELYLATQEAKKEVAFMKENLGTVKALVEKKKIRKCEYRCTGKNIAPKDFGAVIFTNPGKRISAFSLFANIILGAFVGSTGVKRQSDVDSRRNRLTQAMLCVSNLIKDIVKKYCDMEFIVYIFSVAFYFTLFAVLSISLSKVCR